MFTIGVKMSRTPLASLIADQPPLAPTRAGASADYALVRKHFDLICQARDRGFSWRAIAEQAAELESLTSRDPALTLRSYYATIRRQREKAAAKIAPAPAVAPAAQGRSLSLPPPPGATATAPGDIFSNLPQISTKKVDK